MNLEDTTFKRVHFRIPATGLELLKEEAQSLFLTEAALTRQLVLEWYKKPYDLNVFNERPKQQATVQLPVEVVEKIHEICDNRGIKRSALLRNIIMTALTEKD